MNEELRSHLIDITHELICAGAQGIVLTGSWDAAFGKDVDFRESCLAALELYLLAAHAAAATFTDAQRHVVCRTRVQIADLLHSENRDCLSGG